MEKHIPAVVMIAIIVLLLISNIVQYNSFNRDGTIIGTSRTGDGMSPLDEYFIFEKDGKYVIYRQFAILESGTYEEVEDSLYLLSDGTGAQAAYALYSRSEDKVYLIRADEFRTFAKVSDVPFYINVHSEALGATP